MKQGVALKGIKEGFLLNLNDAASFEELMNELDELLDHLKAERKLSGETPKDIHLEIHSGHRLLNDAQKELLSKKIEENSHFSIKSFDSNVLTYERAIEWQKKSQFRNESSNRKKWADFRSSRRYLIDW